MIRLFVFLTVMLSVHAFFMWRVLHHWQVTKPLKYSLICLASAMFVLVPLSFLSRQFDVGFPPWLATMTFILVGTFGILYTFTLLKDLLVFFMWAGNKVAATQPSFSPERRSSLAHAASWLALGGTAAASAGAVINGRRYPNIIKTEVTMPRLPKGLDQLRVVQISDLHVGPTVDLERVRNVVKQVASAKPDIFVMTGDLVDGTVEQLGDIVAELTNVETTYGTYFCTGNHEYYSNAGPWCSFLEERGVHVLNNRHAVIDTDEGKIVMAGVTDLQGGRFYDDHRCDPDLAIAGAPENVACILLAHQPKVAFLTEKGKFDLQLSGHTHGGQFFPFNFLIHFAQKYVSGLYDHEDMKVYVNRGTAYWGPPMRLGPEQEITLITLRSA